MMMVVGPRVSPWRAGLGQTVFPSRPALVFAGRVKYPEDELRASWNDPTVRALIERSIVNGNFKAAPHLGRALIERWDALCSSMLPKEEVYQRLQEYFETLKRRPELQTSFASDKSERVARRITQIQGLLGKIRPRSMVDVGCGDGEITQGLQAAYQLPRQKVIGLEVFVRPNTKSTFVTMPFNGQALPLPDKSQDLVTLFAVLHHAEEPEKLLKDIYRVMAPGGRLLVREFDAGSKELKLFNLVMDFILYKVYTPFPDVPVPGNYFGTRTWNRMFEKAGFKVEKTVHPEPDNPYRPFFSVLVKPRTAICLK
jgi:ubiquinone/menaquinone biosynthesis C-methylase UbiE